MVLAVLSPIMLWFWLGSDSGRAWLSQAVYEWTDSLVEIQGLKGQPLRSFAADRVVVLQENKKVQMQQLHLNWSPLDLLMGELAVENLDIAHVDIHITSANDKAEESATTAVELPFAVSLGRLFIPALLVQQGEEAPTTVQDILLQHVQLSEQLSGSLQAVLASGALSAQLEGSKPQWSLVSTFTPTAEPAFELKVIGQYLEQGKIKLTTNQMDNSIEIKGDWSSQSQNLKANGELVLQAKTSNIQSQWQLDVPLGNLANTMAYSLTLQSKITDESLLDDSVDLASKISYFNDKFTANMDGQGLKIALNYVGEKLSADVMFEDWHSPMRNAKGQISGVFKAWWQPEPNRWLLKGGIDQGQIESLQARMSVDAEGEGEQWSVKHANVDMLGLQLVTSGKGDLKNLYATIEVAGKDIAPALELAGASKASGSVLVKLNVQGEKTYPQVQLSAKGSALRWDNIRLKDFTLAATQSSKQASYQTSQQLSSQTTKLARLNLVATGLNMANKKVVEKLKIIGGRQDNKFNFKLSSAGELESKADFSLNLLTKDKADILFKNLAVAYAKQDLIHLKGAKVKLVGESVILEKTKLSLLNQPSFLALSYTPTWVQGKLDIVRFHPEPEMFGFADFPYQVIGDVAAEFSIEGHPGLPNAKLNLLADSLELIPIQPVEDGIIAESEDQRLVMSHLKLNAEQQDGNLSWQMTSHLSAEGKVESQGNVALKFSLLPWQLEWGQNRLGENKQGEGSLDLEVGRFADMQVFLPQLSPLQGLGKLHFSWPMPFAIEGLLGASQMDWQALGVPELGLDMYGSLLTNFEYGKAAVDFKMHDHDGELWVKGPIDIERRTAPAVHFRNFPLMRLPNQLLLVNGSLSASETNHISLVEGGLDVVNLRFEIPELAPSPTSDLIWQGKGSFPQQKQALSKLNVDLNIHSEAEIYGRGMSLKPQGKLHLGGSFSKPQLTGVLDINSGKIEYRSVKLEIQPESKVTFTGDPKRPELFIKAARTIDKVLAGIVVEGSADKLRSYLYSEPAMSNAEIFTYIATGRPLSSIGSNSGSDLFTAAEFILGQGSLLQEVQGDIQQVSGLDILEIGVDGKGGKIKAGQKLSQDLTLSLEQTVSKDATTAITLEYMLNKSLSVFSKQTMRMAPLVGFRYGKEWFGDAQKK